MFRRFTNPNQSGVRVERRADNLAVIQGYAAVFYRSGDEGTEYEMWEDFRERIMPGAFDRALRERHDAKALFNHDSNFLLGRVGARTVRLSVDDRGLKYEIDAPDTQAGRDTVTSIERGDVPGSSFSFSVHPRGRVSWIEEDGATIRQVEDLDLFDIGPVVFPAYEGTTTSIRSEEREAMERELTAWRKQAVKPDAVAVRLRIVEKADAILAGVK